MRTFTRLLLARLLGPLLLALLLSSPALATTAPPPTGRPLAEALNPDGTLKTGANGSFDARHFRMGTAPDGRPVFRPAGTKGAGDERWADGFNLPNGTDGTVNAVMRSGTDLYIGGSFSIVGGVSAAGIAKWNGTAWSPLGTGPANGVDGTVLALAVAGNGDVYAGGTLTMAGGVAASHVARWNGTAWNALGAGLSGGPNNGPVAALAVAGNGDVYAGGDFTQAGGVPVGHVARWNGVAWSALGAGVGTGAGGGTVYTLAVAGNGDVYVGGAFSQADGVAANSVAKWNGTAWSALGTGLANGVSGAVYALAVAGNGDVYAGGTLTMAGGVAASRVAKWNGTAWSPLGAGVGSSVNNSVSALAVAGNGDVYVGGQFTMAGGVAANSVAKWNGTTWNPLGAGLSGGAPGRFVNIYGLAVAGNGDVYAGGDFTQTGSFSASYVAKWNGTAWSALGTGAGNGLNGIVYAVAVAGNGDVYAGGQFTMAGGVAANYVAKWNGTTWSPLGAGLSSANSYGYVYTLAVAGNGDVYAGGQFTMAGGVAANYVAKWNGTTWSPLGAGLSSANSYGYVYTLAVAGNGDVYAGGNFTQAGGVAANYVAKWNGTAWSSLGAGPANGMNSGVTALAVAGNGDVYAGGNFTQAGGVAASRVAKWNGTAWSPLGAGVGSSVNNIVYALAVAGNGDVYAGGDFTQAGGVAASRVAKWNGTTWSPLSTGLGGSVNGYIVYALAVVGNGDVYAGGYFTQAGGAAANYVAKWNGTAWSALGTGAGNGVNGMVYALALAGNGDVYAGGRFMQAGGAAASRVAKWNGTAWSSLGTGTNTPVSVLAVGPGDKLYAGGSFTATGDYSKPMAHFAIYDPNAPLATTAARATPAAQLFPNPAHGTATLRLPAGAPRLPLTLTDALGRTVRRYPAPATAETVLDLRGQPAGVYVVRCGPFTQRLVVE
ncbi:hypothetical protein [Hymenobacter terricola]|uniref:hypothetical protein n=1 Tax=Hymenobacter terricola TaxID=2819236 RepID=UPI001CF26943|nr:hypothetical protein [Hymenobacter terricola]